MKKIIGFYIVSIMLVGCSHHSYIVKEGDDTVGSKGVVLGYPKKIEEGKTEPQRVRLPERGGDVKGLSYMPNATIFRMNGNYSNNVAVTLSPEGELTYFPAPSDITADSEPVEIGEGWWLNNQGLGPNSVFTKYTFAEYAALPEVPSVEQLKLSIIPGAKVTDFKELPVKLGEKIDPDIVKDYLK